MSLLAWKYKQQITIDNTKIDANLSNFPIVVKLNATNFDFTRAQSTGYDIHFVDSDGITLLSYERERHDSTNQLAEYWVKIPSVSSSTDTVFYIYFGNPTASDGADTVNVWDSNYKMVQHMKDITTSTIAGSTINANNRTRFADNQPIETDGVIGKAQDFDGIEDEITLPNNLMGNFTSATVSGLFYANTINSSGYNYFFASQWTSPYPIMMLFWSGGYVVIDEGNPTGEPAFATAKLTVGIWTYLTFIKSGSTWSAYKNGIWIEDHTSAYYGTIDSLSVPYYLGAFGGSSRYFDGIFDEIRLSDTVRSAAWIKASDYGLRLNTLLSIGSIKSNSNSLFFLGNF
ncbi:MAG TPA: DUF2341 domain-containing protein [candidate division Zixibacteria bacterium]|nr:DUF2341 domain-containing protein [candidate division Zixibacteria bacterium]